MTDYMPCPACQGKGIVPLDTEQAERQERLIQQARANARRPSREVRRYPEEDTGPVVVHSVRSVPAEPQEDTVVYIRSVPAESSEDSS
jgi:hypothetical protein